MEVKWDRKLGKVKQILEVVVKRVVKKMEVVKRDIKKNRGKEELCDNYWLGRQGRQGGRGSRGSTKGKFKGRHKIEQSVEKANEIERTCDS